MLLCYTKQMERKTALVEGEFYHLYNRGVDKRSIFMTAHDYRRFMALLYLANDRADIRVGNILKSTAYADIFTRGQEEPLVAIGSFCLMPNHFHILATPLSEKGIPQFMHKLQTGHSMYFNTKNERSGSLFQGPYKSSHADTDQYLKFLFSYIHESSKDCPCYLCQVPEKARRVRRVLSAIARSRPKERCLR